MQKTCCFPIYLFIHSFICIVIYSYMFILYFGVQSTTALFCSSCHSSSFGHWEIFHTGSYIPMTRPIFLLLENIVTFCHYIMYIPALALESATTSRIPILFYWRMKLETKIWTLSAFISAKMSCLHVLCR